MILLFRANDGVGPYSYALVSALSVVHVTMDITNPICIYIYIGYDISSHQRCGDINIGDLQ